MPDRTLSDDEVFDILRTIKAAVDPLVTGDGPRRPQPAPGSPLAGDDRHTAPHQTSHAAGVALGAATDHLHALLTLILETRALHTRAPFSLARAAIENASTAYWLLEPASRRERIHRTLRYHATDLHDAVQASPDLDAPLLVDRDDRLEQLHVIAERAGHPIVGKLQRVTATAVVTATEHALNLPAGVGPLPAWRVFSGLAHGRSWASDALLHHVRAELGDGLVQVTSQTKPIQVLWAVDIAWTVLEATIELFEIRAASPYGVGTAGTRGTD